MGKAYQEFTHKRDEKGEDKGGEKTTNEPVEPKIGEGRGIGIRKKGKQELWRGGEEVGTPTQGQPGVVEGSTSGVRDSINLTLGLEYLPAPHMTTGKSLLSQVWLYSLCEIKALNKIRSIAPGVCESAFAKNVFITTFQCN